MREVDRGDLRRKGLQSVEQLKCIAISGKSNWEQILGKRVSLPAVNAVGAADVPLQVPNREGRTEP